MPPQAITDLVEAFDRNLESYRSPQYKEAEVRQEFINPLFEALGWDVQNARKYAENYKEVVHEPSLEEESGSRAPDYSFQPGGQLKFYVEAKKPAVHLDRDAGPAHQLRMYGWTKQLPLSILTNFAEFAVYDCRVEPKASDNPAVARLHYFSFREYPQRWDELVSLFSPDAIFKGSFDRFAESRKRRGAAPFDQRFLDDMEDWRKRLAENIALRNPKVSQRDLNYAVQQTIDRTIFLRICEARGIEPFGRLRQVADLPEIYPHLVEYFRAADDAYNSGLFHFRREHGRDLPDELTPGLFIDDAVLKYIIKQLYWPARPYAFEVVPADILGQVYERFLGKVIHLTPGHHAKVDDKPEVKKAGGVYYTPTYIVDYIVKSTVGKLVDGKNWKQAAKLRVLDPACGSGSFLLGAYEYLLNWYRDQYVQDGPEKHKKQLYQTPAGYKLAIGEKKVILLRHIYGVDIDPQAVEVTKLSLLLKVLEGESDQTVKPRLIKEPALPDLGKNIKCGNSLVGSQFSQRQQLLALSEEERFRINNFDWEGRHGFPEIMRAGGFDAVIGNPPYSYRNATEDKLRSYYLAEYKSAEGNFELYKFFIERNLELSRPQGLIGMIVSATFLVQTTFIRLRKILLANSLVTLAPLGPNVFNEATVDTTILIAQKSTADEQHAIQIVTPQAPIELPTMMPYTVRQHRFTGNPGLVFDYKLSDEAAQVVTRIIREFPNIESGYEFGVGINTGYIRDELVANRRIDSRYHRMIPGSGISRYGPVMTDGWIMYDADYIKSRGSLGRTLPAEHLLSSEKILVVRTRNLSLKRRVIATIDTTAAYNLNRLSNIIAKDSYSLMGLLGILNSGLFQWLFSTRFFDYEIKPVYLRNAPLANSNDSKLESLVTEMLLLQRKVSAATTDHQRTILSRQVDTTDSKINAHVYQLYGLSKQEIAIAESAQPRDLD